MIHLYAVRHGQSVLNASRIFAGRTDTPLTDVGREQARLAGEGARELEIDLIITSPLSRTLETAQIIAAQIGYDPTQIVIQPDLIERDLGPLAGQSFDVIRNEAEYPGIESIEHLQARVEKVIAYINAQTAENILIASHGTFLHALSATLAPGKYPDELPNAQIVQFI